MQRRGIVRICKFAHGDATQGRVPVSFVIPFAWHMHHGLIFMLSETKEVYDDEKEDADSTLLTSYFDDP